MTNDNKKIGFAFVPALLVLCLSLPTMAQTGDTGWDFAPSIYVGYTFTDNVQLAPDDAAVEDSSYEITPRLAVTHQGPRWNLDSSYRLQSRRFDKTSFNDQVFHNLDLTSNYAVVGDRFGVDVIANISQQVVDRQLGVGTTTVSNVQNLTDVSTYAVEPYWNIELGSSTTGRMSYRAGLVEFNNPALRDSKDNRFAANLTTAPQDGRWSIGASYTTTDVEFDTGREVSLARISLDLSYRVSPRANFVLTVGDDQNDLGALPTLGDVDGGFWLAGFDGSLGSSTTYEIRAGEQFFGDSYLVELERTRGRLALSLTYNEEATTFGSGQIDYQGLLGFLSDVGGIDLPGVSQDVFVTKRLNFGVSYTLPRSSWQLNVFNDDRQFISSLAGTRDDRGNGLSVSWNWEASPLNRFTFSANYQTFTIRTTGDEPEDLRVDLAWRRTLFARATADIRLSHFSRSSNFVLQTFDSNSVSVGIGYEF
ncbi:MAG: TIGR03016 family PEP-CTERM system-associated outer membrane protein [Gammaproteobacteria bacterium]